MMDDPSLRDPSPAETPTPDAPRVIRVLICDDHELIRQALRAVVDAEDDMEVVGEAVDGEHAVELARALEPDAILMDIQMPKMSGIEATEQIKKILPDTVVLVLTVHESNEYILRILDAGATGYLTKGVITKEIPNAIRSAVRGESTLSGEILKKLLAYALRYGTDNDVADGDPDGAGALTPREREILAMVAEGASNKDIGRRISLTENTVKKYMMGIFTKLGVTSRTAAVVAAQKMGLFREGSQP
jgi:DNA-binding NarL/FixJ family response regulator